MDIGDDIFIEGADTEFLGPSLGCCLECLPPQVLVITRKTFQAFHKSVKVIPQTLKGVNVEDVPLLLILLILQLIRYPQSTCLGLLLELHNGHTCQWISSTAIVVRINIRSIT